MHTEQYGWAGSGQQMEGIFCSPLLSTGEAIFGIQSSFGTTSTKGMWRNWNWSIGWLPSWLPTENELQGEWWKLDLFSLAQRSLSVV